MKLFEGLYSPSCDKPFGQIVILRLWNGDSNCEYVINWTYDEWWNKCVLRCVYSVVCYELCNHTIVKHFKDDEFFLGSTIGIWWIKMILKIIE